jgi:hypothetical protein
MNSLCPCSPQVLFDTTSLECSKELCSFHLELSEGEPLEQRIVLGCLSYGKSSLIHNFAFESVTGGICVHAPEDKAFLARIVNLKVEPVVKQIQDKKIALSETEEPVFPTINTSAFEVKSINSGEVKSLK